MAAFMEETTTQYEKEEKHGQKKLTRKREIQTMRVLAVMSFVTGGLIFPFTPLDDEDSFVMSNLLFAAFLGHILYPTLVVFWRSFTK